MAHFGLDIGPATEDFYSFGQRAKICSLQSWFTRVLHVYFGFDVALGATTIYSLQDGIWHWNKPTSAIGCSKSEDFFQGVSKVGLYQCQIRTRCGKSLISGFLENDIDFVGFLKKFLNLFQKAHEINVFLDPHRKSRFLTGGGLDGIGISLLFRPSRKNLPDFWQPMARCKQNPMPNHTYQARHLEVKIAQKWSKTVIFGHFPWFPAKSLAIYRGFWAVLSKVAKWRKMAILATKG